MAISGEIPVASYTAYRSTALISLQERVSIDGFRKGKIPENVLVKHVGEQALLIEMAERAVSDAYRELVAEEKLDVVSDPSFNLTKLAPGNPIGFTITVIIMPEVKLPDYMAIAKRENAKKDVAPVTEKDIAEAVFEIRKSKIPSEIRDQKELKPEDFAKNMELHMPALNDAFVQGVGDFKTVEEFTHKLREHLVKQKEETAQDKVRGAIADALIKDTEIDLPEAFVDGEVSKMTAQLKSDIAGIGMGWEDYLKRIAKTEEEVTKEWRPEAEKRARFELILHKIAEVEKLTPNSEEVHTETHHMMEHYPDADHDRVMAYVATMKTREKVWLFLDNPVEGRPHGTGDGVMPELPQVPHDHDHSHGHH